MKFNRRQFMKFAVTTLGVLAAGPVSALETPVVMRRPKFGVGLWTVREQMAEDAPGTLAAIARLGYPAVEISGLGVNPMTVDPFYGLGANGLRSACDDLGLLIPSASYFGETPIIAEVAPLVHQLGAKQLVLGLHRDLLPIPDFAIWLLNTFPSLLAILNKLPISPDDGAGQPRQPELFQQIAAQLNDAGKLCREEGLRFAYHNHADEFYTKDGFLPFDILMAETDPELVYFQLDVGWVAAAGAKPVPVLEKYGQRIVSCHLKDFNPNRKLAEGHNDRGAMSRMETPGQGLIDFPGVLALMDHYDMEWGFVEVDEPRDALESLEQALSYLGALPKE